MPSYTEKTKIIYLDLPVRTQEAINAIKKIYNPEAIKRGPSHITFKQDEDFTIENSRLIELVESETKGLEPFILEMNGIKIHYDNDNFIVFASFKSNPALNLEIAKLSKVLQPYVDKKSPNALDSTLWEQSTEFFPHITIATGKGLKEGEVLYKKIISHDFNAKEQIICNSLTILEWDKDYWKEIHHIYL